MGFVLPRPSALKAAQDVRRRERCGLVSIRVIAELATNDLSYVPIFAFSAPGKAGVAIAA